MSTTQNKTKQTQLNKYNKMAENNIADNQTNEKFQSVVKRKFERFRTKLAELFFATQPPVTNTANFNSLSIQKHNHHHHHQHAQHAQQQPDDNSSMLISNCYYGYTSPITEEDLRISCKKKSKRFNKNHHHTSSNSSASSSSACSSSSSIIIDDDEHSTFSNYTSQPQTGKFPNTHPLLTLTKTKHQQTFNMRPSFFFVILV